PTFALPIMRRLPSAARRAKEGEPLLHESFGRQAPPASALAKVDRRQTCRIQAPLRRGLFFGQETMHADLERLIALQRLDSAADAARRKLADEPEHEKAL